MIEPDSSTQPIATVDPREFGAEVELYADRTHPYHSQTIQGSYAEVMEWLDRCKAQVEHAWAKHVHQGLNRHNDPEFLKECA